MKYGLILAALLGLSLGALVIAQRNAMSPAAPASTREPATEHGYDPSKPSQPAPGSSAAPAAATAAVPPPASKTAGAQESSTAPAPSGASPPSEARVSQTTAQTTGPAPAAATPSPKSESKSEPSAAKPAPAAAEPRAKDPPASSRTGLYLWLWIILANLGAIILLSGIGGGTTSMGQHRDEGVRQPDGQPPARA